MTESPDRSRFRFVVPALAVAVFVAAVTVVPLIDETYRLWNFAAFGAIALYVAARGGRFSLPLALALALGLKLLSDFLNYAHRGYDPDYLPFTAPWLGLALYTGLACYAVIGWRLLKATENPLKIGGAAFLGSMVFFLWTNFVSWLRQALPYPQTVEGLLQSYAMGLPFWRGTLTGDLAFGSILFALHAVVVRLPLMAARTAAVRIEHTPRSESR